MKNLEKETKNRYSFFTVEKTEDFLDYEKDMHKHNKKQTLENANINFFSYNNIHVQYSFTTGSCTMYHDLGTDELAVLYEKCYENDNELYNLYNSNGIYTATKTNNGFKYILYSDKIDFFKVCEVSIIHTALFLLYIIMNLLLENHIKILLKTFIKKI